MVPTRQRSTSCRRRICALTSGAMVMAGSRWGRMAQPAQAHPGRQHGPAASARPAGWWPGWVGQRLGRRRTRQRRGRAPCRQWSIGRHPQGTLVRHVLASLSLAPVPRTRSMGEPPTPAALVSGGRLVSCRSPRQARAHPRAVALAPVAAAAQQHLHPAACAQEQSGRCRLGRVHLQRLRLVWPKVLDAVVLQRHTGVAPLVEARCRVRRGSAQAVKLQGPLPRPPYSAWVRPL